MRTTAGMQEVSHAGAVAEERPCPPVDFELPHVFFGTVDMNVHATDSLPYDAGLLM
jgi:hypothetical protein